MNWLSHDKCSALMIACKNASSECIDLLLEAKADPNLADHMNIYPLHIGLIQLVKC